LSSSTIEPSSAEPRAERRDQPDLARPRLLLLRQPARDDRQEDDVVHAEHDFHRGERQQAEQEGGQRLLLLTLHLDLAHHSFPEPRLAPGDLDHEHFVGEAPAHDAVVGQRHGVVRAPLRVALECDPLDV